MGTILRSKQYGGEHLKILHMPNRNHRKGEKTEQNKICEKIPNHIFTKPNEAQAK